MCRTVSVGAGSGWIRPANVVSHDVRPALDLLQLLVRPLFLLVKVGRAAHCSELCGRREADLIRYWRRRSTNGYRKLERERQQEPEERAS